MLKSPWGICKQPSGTPVAFPGDLEILILIPATSHSAANWSSERWRSQTESEPHHLQKVAIPSPLNCNPPLQVYASKPWPWISQTGLVTKHTENESDLLLRIWTMLSVWRYRDWMALSSDLLTPYSSDTFHNISREPGHKPSLDPQNTCRLVGQTPNLQACNYLQSTLR